MGPGFFDGRIVLKCDICPTPLCVGLALDRCRVKLYEGCDLTPGPERVLRPRGWGKG